ncbi:hypothetical protein VQ366_004718 [Salmonella enterica]|nr:hypothetical protein [Salmonella enterica]EBU7310730.1 hypothetical protein [Salmonella enterica subsp. enterica serovar Panama]EHK3918008.1 hypothetical protein [Salmonella enterica subsp. enterica serovar Poona]EID8040918.1 hypothetical protein [Salmonella enterica]EMD3747609.1 hypothetical protein [Salmonella enterica]
MTSTFGKQLKLYADRQKGSKRTALDFQYVVAAGKDAYTTVNISMAPISDETNEAQWDHKRVIQLNRYELTQCCAVLFGLEKELRANFHGTEKNKGFTLINNGASGCGINFSLGGDMLTHMLNHAQRMEVGAFILKRQADAWDMSVSDVLALLRQSVSIKRA